MEDGTTSSSGDSVQADSSETVAVEPAQAQAQACEPVAPAPLLMKPPGLSTPVSAPCRPILPLPVPAFQPPVAMQTSLPYCIPTPMAYNSGRFCPMPANPQSKEGTDAAQIKQFSGGRPVKVSVPVSTNGPNKQLKPTIPAKKRPPYPESITAPRPTLDPSQPVKKRVPSFSESFLEGLLKLEFASLVPSVVEVPASTVPSVPAVLVPR